MAADLRRVFGPRFVALVVGGSGATAAFATEVSAPDLDALAVLVDTWRREGAGVPLLMTPGEFHRSLDVFPAEYQSLLDHHVLIAGTDPFNGASVRPEDLRRACEAQARGHLIHLRQGWLDHAAHGEGLAELIAQSAGRLRQVLMNLARLDGESVTGDAALAEFAGRRTGMPADLVAAIFASEESSTVAHGLVARLPEYLAACERLWSFLDTWRAR
jgi:hypothetical protein